MWSDIIQYFPQLYQILIILMKVFIENLEKLSNNFVKTLYIIFYTKVDSLFENKQDELKLSSLHGENNIQKVAQTI